MTSEPSDIEKEKDIDSVKKSIEQDNDEYIKTKTNKLKRKKLNLSERDKMKNQPNKTGSKKKWGKGYR